MIQDKYLKEIVTVSFYYLVLLCMSFALNPWYNFKGFQSTDTVGRDHTDRPKQNFTAQSDRCYRVPMSM